MPTESTEIKNVFISHIHEDDDGLRKLKNLLQDNGLSVRDYSISSDNPNNAHSDSYIKSEILAPRIRQCSTLVVYVSPETKDSPWVAWEIEYAQKHDKRVVGVWAHGERGCDIPEALNEYADAMVGWHGNSIVDAIIGGVDSWQKPDGSPVPPRRVTRYSCG